MGAGPAGFYAAQHLVKKLDNSEIDIFERLPVPFGLVRFGVAPDHPEVKNVIHTFSKTAQHPNVRFFGNINLGTDISLQDLKDNYHVVLLTYGAEENRQLNIPGEDLHNVIPARKIVGWYNGIPDDSNLEIDLSGNTMAIFGQGNVAVDVARILLTPVDELKKTDITQHALDKISQSKIKQVHLIGRRGPLQAAFTIKELREMLKLQQCQTVWKKEDFSSISKEIVENLARPKKRITELMLKSLQDQKSDVDGLNVFKPIFFRSPLEILGNKKVERVILGVNRLEGEDILKQHAVLTDRQEELECNIVVPSIGYKSVQADPLIPFDQKKGIIINNNSKVNTGLYTTGWLGTAPVGVILTTMSNAFGTAERILKDIHDDNLLNEDKGGFTNISSILKEKRVPIVDWAGWEKIDKYEIEEGKKHNKPREKIIDVNKMLEIGVS